MTGRTDGSAEIGEAATPVLEYAPRPRWWRRVWVGRVVKVVVVCAVVAVVWQWGVPLWHHVSMQYWVRKCLAYEMPRDLVVYDEGEEESEFLGVAGYEAIYLKPGHPAAAAGLPSPVGFVPEPWRRLYPKLAGGREADATVFMGMLRSPGGNERLVVVDVVIAPSGGGMINSTRTMVINPGSMFRRAKVLSVSSMHGEDHTAAGIRGTMFGPVRIGPYANDRMMYGRVLAGQVHDNDPSRCWISASAFGFAHWRLTDDETLDRVILSYAVDPDESVNPFEAQRMAHERSEREAEERLREAGRHMQELEARMRAQVEEMRQRRAEREGEQRIEDDVPAAR
jgi:hypothetical protein